MRKEIKRLHQRLETTSIYVTHDQTEAMTMADRIVVMNAGRVEQTGSPLELYNTPQNLFVAGFIGAPQMNLLSGVVLDIDGERKIRVGSAVLPAPPDVEGQAVTWRYDPAWFSELQVACFRRQDRAANVE